MKLINSSNPAGKSRSEVARQRRTENSQQRISRVNHNVTSPVRRTTQTPPVTVRGSAVGLPLHQKTRGKVRRQYYYALGNTGAEVRLPAMPAINPGWRILSAVIVLTMFLGIYMAYNSSTFQVSQVTFNGLQRLKPADILEVVSVSNKPVFTIDPSQVQTNIEKAFPELKDVKVSVTLPAKVTVTAEERQPVVVWQYKDESLWVDKDGYIFNPRGKVSGLVAIQSDEQPPVVFTGVPDTGQNDPLNPDAASTPTPAELVMSKSLVGQQMDPDVLKAAQALNKFIPARTTLAYTAKDGLGWSDPAGWNVFVGVNLEDIDLKMKVYRAVVAKLDQDGVKPVMISVENLHAPFYRLEQ